MSVPALDVKGVYAAYSAGLDILRGIDLRVEEGEIVTVLGPNGAGKSTLIKAVAGLVRVREGHVRLFGKDITNMASHQLVRTGIGYVPQVQNVFAKLSVEENLEMGAYSNSSGMQERIQQMYRTFPDLGRHKKHPAGKLSGGQRQMVAVARALMVEPKVLMLDEPSAGLSPLLVREVFEKVREVRDLGVTILIVEQNAKAALAISDRGYVLAEGKDRMTGQAADLLVNPEVGELYLGSRRGLA